VTGSNYREYFLGVATENDAAEIEVRVVDDADFAIELSVAEHDLIESFLDGNLSDREAELFDSNYLVTAAREQNVEMIRLMRVYARENAGSFAAESVEPGRSSVGLRGWFGLLGPGTRLATASILLIAILMGVWFAFFSNGDGDRIALQQQYERLNRDPARVGSNSNTPEIVLVSGSLRSAGSAPVLRRDGLGDDIRFRIALPSGMPARPTYDVTVFRGSSEIFAMRSLPSATLDPSELTFILPRSILVAGAHRIVIRSEAVAELSYNFSVE
jgi:hypothetical protein